MENQSQESNQTELHLGASFLPHPVPPPVDCCEYHYTYCPSSNVDLNEADGTPAYDKPEGVPCLVPSNMIPHSPEGVKKCDGHLHGPATVWPDGSPIVCPEMSPIPVYPAHFRCPSMHQAYFSPVACVPNLQNTEEFWTQHGASQCVPQSQTSSTDSEGQLEQSEAELKNERCKFTEKRRHEGVLDHTGQLRMDHRFFPMVQEDQGCCVDNAYNSDPHKTCSFTRRIRDPNVLPVVDLTKSEMELFTLRDFKEKKLDYIQKKTEKEKSTALVVCIDHGMCAAFYLPKDSLYDGENENGANQPTEEMIEKPVIPSSINNTRRYLSVKKSLDKIFPSSAGNAENQVNESLFLNTRESDPATIACTTAATACSNYSHIAKDISEQEEAIRNIPQSPLLSDSD